MCVCVFLHSCFASLQGVFQVSALTERQEVLDSILGFVRKTQAIRLAAGVNAVVCTTFQDTVLRYQLEGGKIFIHLQAGTKELCILHASAS